MFVSLCFCVSLFLCPILRVHFNYQKDTLQRMARTAIVPVMIMEEFLRAVPLPMDDQWALWHLLLLSHAEPVVQLIHLLPEHQWLEVHPCWVISQELEQRHSCKRNHNTCHGKELVYFLFWKVTKQILSYNRNKYRTPMQNRPQASSVDRIFGLITPKVQPNMPLAILRRARVGETVFSVTGSPVITAA